MKQIVRAAAVADIDRYEKYLVFFRIHPRHVEFKRLIHGARHLPRLFRR